MCGTCNTHGRREDMRVYTNLTVRDNIKQDLRQMRYKCVKWI